ncbi:hypothetical protein C7475_1187 [Chitinophaga sp. S165]|nr:hypothetical protein C7475_1187 [Chitinophaga sp. S165]
MPAPGLGMTVLPEQLTKAPVIENLPLHFVYFGELFFKKNA